MINKSAQCFEIVIIAGNFAVQNFFEIAEVNFRVKYVNPASELSVMGSIVIVIIIGEITYNFFQNVIHGNDALCASIFVNNYGNVRFLILKIAKQVVQFF